MAEPSKVCYKKLNSLKKSLDSTFTAQVMNVAKQSAKELALNGMATDNYELTPIEALAGGDRRLLRALSDNCPPGADVTISHMKLDKNSYSWAPTSLPLG